VNIFEFLAIASPIATILGILFVIWRDWKKAKTEALAVDIQARESEGTVALTEVEIDDRIAARRLEEIRRLDEKVRNLESDFAKFKETSSARNRAFANVLRDAAEQWPKDEPGPVFAAEDIAALEDTMPHQWRRRLRPK
jgi:hypothetical protein